MGVRHRVFPAVAGAALLAATAAGQTHPERPKPPLKLEAGQPCTHCHGDLVKRVVVHSPARDGVCDACHEQQGAGHSFRPTARAADLCGQCHEDLLEGKGPLVHEPVAKGLCLACHDPHGTAERKLLKLPEPKVCARCHQAEGKLDQAHVHGPAAKDGCTVCHKPHAAPKPKLLENEGRAVCLACHDDPAAGLPNGRVHLPVRQDCVQCHDPHQSPNRYQLSMAQPALCLDCHDDVKNEMARAEVPHKALAAERSCLGCHDPHGRPEPKLLRARDPGDLCLRCHEKIAGHLAANPDLHGPLRERSCVACHKPHGAGFALLKAGFPATFYAPFENDAYALCFSCHPRELALEPRTVTATGFRDGDRNLHYLHVNRDKGRTCRACHDPHGTKGPKHVRASFAFGAWDAPVRFEKRETGGACAPACHVRRGYERPPRRP